MVTKPYSTTEYAGEINELHHIISQVNQSLVAMKMFLGDKIEDE